MIIHKLHIFWFHSRPLRLVVVLLLALGLAAHAQLLARDTSTRTLLTGQRVMQTFNFEERGTHFEESPMFWKKLDGGPGFPHYAKGTLDRAFHRSGQYSFKLFSDGGSVAYDYHPRYIPAEHRIPVNPGSDFQLTAYVHFEQAVACRARVTCTLYDRAVKAIPKSRHSSELLATSEQGADGWARLEVYIPGNFPTAQYLGISLYLLQEEQWRQGDLADRAIFKCDVKAAAWFDDITVYQLPRVVLFTDNTANVFRHHESPNLKIEVSGVNSLDYQVRLNVCGAQGSTVHQDAWGLTGFEGATETRQVRLPDLPAGLYHAELQILSDNILVATRNLTFAKLAPLHGSPQASGSGFGIVALDCDNDAWGKLTDLIQLCDARLVKLPVWRRRADDGPAIFSERDFGQTLTHFHQRNIQVMATFSEFPDALAARVAGSGRSVLDGLSQDPQLWRGQVVAVLARYARQVPFWQIGADIGSQNQLWDPRIQNVVVAMRKEFQSLISDPVLAVPLSAMFQVAADQVATDHTALTISSAIAAHQIPEYIADARQRGLQNVYVSLESLPEDQYLRQHRLVDFAKRIIYAHRQEPRAIFIDRPWRQRQNNARQVTEPTEQLLVFRTLADHLGATQYLGQLQLAPDVPALIFDRDGVGCLCAWNEKHGPNDSVAPQPLRLYLGRTPQMVDLWGNKTALPTENGLTTVALTDWPVLITGIDTRLAALRASIQLNPQTLDASFLAQNAQIEFVNPYAMAVSGRLRFLPSQQRHAQWAIDPSVVDFTLQPGQRFRQPLVFRFPRNEVAGPKKLPLLISLDADRSYRLTHQVPFEIQLSGVEMSIFARRLGPQDLLVQQVVTNLSDQQMALQCFIDLPDNDRLERAIPNLQPGSTVYKTFRVPNAVRWLGQALRVGLYDPQKAKRVNYTLPIN